MTTSVDPLALRDARQRVGLTQSQVARALGMAGGEAISVWERGAFEPRSATQLHALAKVLGVRVPELLHRDEGKIDLRFLRLVAGLESADLAERLHVSLATYRRWERGAWTRTPSEATIAGLANALAASPDVVAGALAYARALGSRNKT